jgi:hypothetical protein
MAPQASSTAYAQKRAYLNGGPGLKKPQAKKTEKPVGALPLPKGRELSPEQVIPLGDEQFKEF